MDFDLQEYYVFYMSYSLVDLLGFEKYDSVRAYTTMQYSDKGSYISKDPIDIHAGLNVMYAYCDVASYSLVGDIRAPLLRVIPTSSGKHGDMIERIYSEIQYVPVHRNQIESIEVNINNELGQPMPFEFGKVILTLHFRRRP